MREWLHRSGHSDDPVTGMPSAQQGIIMSLLGPHLPRRSRAAARVADGQRPRAQQHLSQRRRVRQALQHAVHEARVAQVAQAGALRRTARE